MELTKNSSELMINNNNMVIYDNKLEVP